MTVSTALLDASNVFQATQPLAPGANLTVSLTNSNPASGTVPATAVILAGTSDATVSFTPLVGSTQTTLGVTQPSGYTQPTQFTSLLARVNP